jgi:hypothetical protein
MKFEGGCYCRKIRYVAEGEPRLKAQCHCRECQYISGGAPNMFMLMPPQGFRYTSGEPRQFSRSDLEGAVTREFCGECGTHLTTRRPGLPLVILKVGTLDNPVYLAHRKWRSTLSTGSPSMSFRMACRRLSVCLRANRSAFDLDQSDLEGAGQSSIHSTMAACDGGRRESGQVR